MRKSKEQISRLLDVKWLLLFVVMQKKGQSEIGKSELHTHKRLEQIIRVYQGKGCLPEGTLCSPIYTGRNKLYYISLPDHERAYVVKHFATLGLLRRIYYSYLGVTKAARSYYYAKELLNRGINTPLPLAYTEHRNCFGLIGSCFYSCLYLERAENIHPQMNGWSAPDSFIEELTSFLTQVHQAGIEHLDLSPGNVLYTNSATAEKFCLVDLNRMRFRSRTLTLRDAARNLARLPVKKSVSRRIARCYASERGWSVEDTIHALETSTNAFWLNRLKKLARRQYLNKVSNKGWIYFESIYLGYRILRALRKGLTFFPNLSRQFFRQEEALYLRYLAKQDVRQVLRHRENYSYAIHPRED